MTPSITPQRSVFLRRARGGVSLLEVLFAIGILMVGLLGVASVIPAGRLEMVEAGKADRASACAQALLRDLKVRGLLDPHAWRDRNGNPVPLVSGRQTLLRCRTYAIDPLFVANNQGNANVENFPFQGTTQMRRITLAQRPGTNTILPLSEAERLCTWNDDLLFADPANPDDRPRETVQTDLSRGIPWPIRASDRVTGTHTAMLVENTGDFTWLLTVTPIGPMIWEEHDGSTPGTEAYVDIDQPLSYQVSVVIFFRRDRTLAASPDPEEPPSERAITSIQFLGGGLSGGDVLLTDTTRANYLTVKENDWLMVPLVPPGSPPRIPTPFAWYRVVATDEGPLGAWTRNVTIEGSDYTFDTPTVHNIAVLFSNVVSVFTATIQSEGRD